MEQRHVESIEGAPTPADIFEPHMPGVELLSDMDALFAEARRLSATGEYPASHGRLLTEAAAASGELKGKHSVVVVTPGRILMPIPAPEPGSVPVDSEEAVRQLMPPDPPLVINAVSYTHVKALLTDKGKAIPFLGFLVGFASIGHTVTVFEGHPSAFESGVRGGDVLLVDSAMRPFLQKDWAEVAFKVMRPRARVLVHERETFKLKQLFPPRGGPTPIPTGVSNADIYAGTLIRLLISGQRTSARITSGEPLPPLADFATRPQQLEELASLPFSHEDLDADEVIDQILKAGGWGRFGIFKRTGVIKIPVMGLDGRLLGKGACGVTLGKDEGGRRRVILER
jgi:hypothetical protein